MRSCAISAALHVEQWAQRRAAHPEDTKTLVVRKYFGAANFIDVFRRKRSANDAKALPAAVDDSPDGTANVQVIGARKSFADEHFVRVSRLDVPAAAKEQVVQHWSAMLGNGNEASNCGFLQPGNVKIDLDDDPGLHYRNTGNRADFCGKAIGCALQLGKDISKPVAAVMFLLRKLDRLIGAAHSYVGGDARSDD